MKRISKRSLVEKCAASDMSLMWWARGSEDWWMIDGVWALTGEGNELSSLLPLTACDGARQWWRRRFMKFRARGDGGDSRCCWWQDEGTWREDFVTIDWWWVTQYRLMWRCGWWLEDTMKMIMTISDNGWCHCWIGHWRCYSVTEMNGKTVLPSKVEAEKEKRLEYTGKPTFGIFQP